MIRSCDGLLSGVFGEINIDDITETKNNPQMGGS